MELTEFLDEQLIQCRVVASTKEELLEMMALKLYDEGYVKKEYIDGVLAREALNPTGLQLDTFGCAVPHSEMGYVLRPTISIAVLEEPVAFQRMDDPSTSVDVHLVFMLAVNEGMKQVSVLQKLTGLMQNSGVFEELLHAQDASEVMAIINNFEKVR